MRKQRTLVENETQKILFYFEILTDQTILFTRPYLVLIKKKKIICHLVVFVVLADLRMKVKEN